MATVARANTTAGRRNSWIVRIVIGVAILGVVLFVGWIVVTVFGAVAGTEFSPDTFDRRTFLYYELPLVRLRLTPVYYEPDAGLLAQYLQADEQLLPPSDADPERWRLVELLKSGHLYTGDPEILTRYLDATSDGGYYWHTWTMDHSTLAPILWPAVAEAARRDLYNIVPELFDTAEQLTVEDTEPGEEEFQAAIDDVLIRQYTTYGDLRRQAEEHAEAIELYSAVLERNKDHPAALRGRQISYAALGEADKAKADRERLTELNKGT